MIDNLLRLFPAPGAQVPLAGLYLSHDLHTRSGRDGAPFVYTNFIASLDGRISEPDPSTGLRRVPHAIANARDWRLYLELAAQADVLLTTAGHLRALAAGRHPAMFNPRRDAELAAWRISRGLAPQPAVAAVSDTLEIPVDEVRRRYTGPLLAVTGKGAPELKADRLRASGMDVVRVPSDEALNGRAIVEALARRGYGRVYSVAGPRVTHALVADDCLDRLYLTLAHLVLGGREFDTLAFGRPLMPPARFGLLELHFDEVAPEGAGQLLATYVRVH